MFDGPLTAIQTFTQAKFVTNKSDFGHIMYFIKPNG